MKNKKLDSSNTSKAIPIVIAVIVVIVAIFAFRRFHTKKVELEQLSIERDMYLRKLRGMDAEREKRLVETKEMIQKTEEYAERYPSDLSQAKAIQNIHEITEASGIEVSGIRPTFFETFYEQKKATPTPAPADGDDLTDPEVSANTAGNGAGENQAAATPTPVPERDRTESVAEGEVNYSNLVGFVTKMDVSFTASYEQLRKTVDYVKNRKDKMTIENINFSFQESTGKLAGSMTIHMYFVVGGSNPYEEPEVDGVDLSKDPLFSTVK